MINDLLNKIHELHSSNAQHVKRGFKVSEIPALVISNHLIEEVTELQAEVIDDDREAFIEEASHVLAVFLHLLQKQGLSLNEIATRSLKMLETNFTTDPAEVTAVTDGYTRKHRS